VSETAGPSKSSKQMLGILNLLAFQGKYRLYEGTTNPKVVARRRAKNRVARISRRANR
jgi:hypothetical protein